VEDSYEMGSELGRGGFAVVYAGKNKSTGEAVAVKIIEKKFVDANELKCLVREIDIMKKVCVLCVCTRTLAHIQLSPFLFAHSHSLHSFTFAHGRLTIRMCCG
jgi:serine/threonine protein kinase